MDCARRFTVSLMLLEIAQFSVAHLQEYEDPTTYFRNFAGKGLNSWLSFVVSNCEFVTFPLVSWVRYGT